MADDVLYQGVKGVTDLMVRPGLINLDFADVRAVMDEMGKAMMGTGEGSGEDRAIQAAEKAIANPLLDEISLKGAKGVLINITGGQDLTLFELDEAANRIREEVDADANIIVGSTLDEKMDGEMRVSVVATGIDAEASTTEVPVPRRKLSEPLTQTPAIEQGIEVPLEDETAIEEPVYAQPAVADTVVPETRVEEEPSLFAREEPVQQPSPAMFRSERAAPEAPMPQAAAAEHPTTPGAPSPEAMARLQAAVRKSPIAPLEPAPAPAPTVVPAEQPVSERPRFGINSLINRMTGHTGEAPERPVQQVRRQPPVQAEPDALPPSPEEERIEIPAFLRRQAN
jgi:cell division protein FtsZ